MSRDRWGLLQPTPEDTLNQDISSEVVESLPHSLDIAPYLWLCTRYEVASQRPDCRWIPKRRLPRQLFNSIHKRLWSPVTRSVFTVHSS